MQQRSVSYIFNPQECITKNVFEFIHHAVENAKADGFMFDHMHLGVGSDQLMVQLIFVPGHVETTMQRHGSVHIVKTADRYTTESLKDFIEFVWHAMNTAKKHGRVLESMHYGEDPEFTVFQLFFVPESSAKL